MAVMYLEAHTIRQQKTFLFKGINAIEGQRRWAVTGTPIQSKLPCPFVSTS